MVERFEKAYRHCIGQVRGVQLAALSYLSTPKRRASRRMKTRAQERSDSSVAPPIVKIGNTFPKKHYAQRVGHNKSITSEKKPNASSASRPCSLILNMESAPITASRLQQFLPPIIERKSFRGVDTRLTKARF
jgi:hypothetical protein